jgi:hypothetical protein
MNFLNNFRRFIRNDSNECGSKRTSQAGYSRAHLRFEQLEARQMLSITPGDFPVTGEDTLTAEGIAIDRYVGPETPPLPQGLEGKIDDELWRAVDVIEKAVKSGGLQVDPGSAAPADINLAKIADATVTEAGKILVYARTGVVDKGALDEIESLGIEVVSANAFLGITESWVPYDKVDDLAALDSVGFVWLPTSAILQTGIVNSDGDSILNADDVRSQLGVDGTGVKIGVISDGVSNRAQVQGGASPDLPTITVNPSRPGSGDEGTAMLEIIHDLAPGAQLFFSSGASGIVAMVDSIDWLVDHGVDVIVDDLGFLDQHYFSDDMVAQAVTAAIDAGVVYVTAAGNQAQWHYQGQWSVANGVHDFDATAAIDNLLNVGVVPAGGIIDVFLQWSDAEGNSGNDYNLGLWNVTSGGYLITSLDAQTGTENPIESFRWTNTTGAPISVAVTVDDFNSPASRELELFVIPRNFSLANLTDTNRITTNSVFGHGAVLDAIAVGAINASDPGNDAIASYSNQGTSTIYTNFVSQAKTLRTSLDGTGIDGVQTRIGQLGYFSQNPFFGTSAAAPHVAAIVALMLETNPLLTPAQANSVLNATAVDVGVTGYDNVSGFGRFDALAAVKAVPPQVLNVTISRSVSNPYGTNPAFEFDEVDGSQEQLRTVPVGGANRIAIQFSEDVVISQGDLDFIALNQVVTEPSISSFDPPETANNFTATWTYLTEFPRAQYLIKLSGDIEDLTGNALDGEWTNPGSVTTTASTSVFPSGDGAAGGDFEFVITILPGDATGPSGTRDNQILIGDHNTVLNNQSLTAATFEQGDFTGDGKVLIGDYNYVSNDYGKDFRNLDILADYDSDRDLDAGDETNFLSYYSSQNASADLNGDGNVNTADYDAFYDLFDLDVSLNVDV